MPLIVVAVAGAEFLAMNPGRQTLSLGNEGMTNLFVSNMQLGGLDQVNAKWRLAPGDVMDFSLIVDGKEIWQPWSVISDAAGGLLRYADMVAVE